ncbi:hypothetical protein [Pleionea sediminis]|uniref:hypothetical protein n=1 Tax=Pleionea sediminis TaxID=2569479 RepID=UPI0013DD9A77|nr:hypothetical protein [Pleionea sediminis]
MIQLLKRYASENMDQWELWKFETKNSEVYIDISRYPSKEGTESAYVDLNHLLK